MNNNLAIRFNTANFLSFYANVAKKAYISVYFFSTKSLNIYG